MFLLFCAGTGLLVQFQGPAFSAAEVAARDNMHSLMQQHPAFLAHVLHAYCAQGRAVELLLLPPAFHDHIADVLASVRPAPPAAWSMCCF